MDIWGTCVVVKRHKRLHIEIMESGKLLYTPPDFVKLHSREPLQALAEKFTRLQRRDVGLIAEFEYQHGANSRGLSSTVRAGCS